MDFSGAELNISIFQNARLEDVSFEGANLSGASFAVILVAAIIGGGAVAIARIF